MQQCDQRAQPSDNLDLLAVQTCLQLLPSTGHYVPAGRLGSRRLLVLHTQLAVTMYQCIAPL